MKMKGSQLRQALSALVDGLPEAFVSDSLGVDRATVRYWRAHSPSKKMASHLIGDRVKPEPKVQAVKS